MKKIRLYSIIVLLNLSLLTACSEDFLDTNPTQSVGENYAEGTKEGLNALLEGIHYMMYSYGVGIGRGQESFGAELDFLGDDVINTRPTYYADYYRYQAHINPKGSFNYYAWDYYYTLILHANKLIGGVGRTEGLSESTKNMLLGEGHAFRAWSYFQLVQLFGKRYVKGAENNQLGVLIRTEENMKDPLPRVSVAETYAFIDKEINLALEHLKEAPDKEIKNAIRYSTACGIAAEIALTKSEWAAAEKYANEAIEKSGATLQSGEELTNGFNDWNASEWMWAYTQAETQDFYYSSFFAKHSYNFKSNANGGRKFAVNRTIYDKMGVNDIRRKWWVCLDQGDEIPEDAYYRYFRGWMSNPQWEITGQSIKYKARSASESHGDMFIMRLAEMYYIKAEAQARQGKDAEARATLNKIMITRDPQYATAATGQELIDEVMRNKRIDLWMEGHRFYDMKRLGVVPNRLSAKNFDYLSGANLSTAISRNQGDYAKFIPTTIDDRGWEFAIPYKEILGNKLCEQNPLK